VNFLATRKREHSRKPDEAYPIIESCSPGPFIELFARGARDGWTSFGDEANTYSPAAIVGDSPRESALKEDRAL
jgi:N6-adenosine-specific RNA methylase IME4